MFLQLTFIRLSQLRQYEWAVSDFTRAEFLDLMATGTDLSAVLLVYPLLEYQEYADQECRTLNSKIEKHRGTAQADTLRQTRDFFLATGLVAYTTFVWEKLQADLAHLDLFQTGQESAEEADLFGALLEGTEALKV